MLISIIVPVYNAGLYLRQCIDSLLNQTYRDIELILIDDGSTDNSLSVCREFEIADSRVSVYHKENSGVSETRNFGLDHARGELISFCDSDDYIEKNAYETLLKAMMQSDADRVTAGYAYLYDNNRIVKVKPRVEDGVYAAREVLTKMIDDGTLSGVLFSGVNNSLFKRSIIEENKIRFNAAIKYNEDGIFSISYMLHSERIYAIQSNTLYYYRQHQTSSTSKRAVGDVYEPFRQALSNMGIEHCGIDFDKQMTCRVVTETLWQIMDIARKENYSNGIRMIRRLVNDEKLVESIEVIDANNLNRYKRIFYVLMKQRSSLMLYVLAGKVLPIATKYISR